MSKLIRRSAVSLLLAIFLAQAFSLIRTNSAVSDEVAHILSGYSYLTQGKLDLNPEHPPLVKQLAAIPLVFMKLASPLPGAKGPLDQYGLGWSFLYSMGNPAEAMIFRSRLILLPMGVLLGLLIFFWTKDLWGEDPAFIVLALYAFFPELIIHSSLVCTDFAGALFFFATFFFLHRFHRSKSLRYLWLAGISGGFALISKFSMIQILPLFYAFAFLSFLDDDQIQPKLRFPVWLLVTITVIASFHTMSALILVPPAALLFLNRLFPSLPVLNNSKVRFAIAFALVLLSLSFLVVMLDYFEYSYWFEKFRPFKRFFRGWAIFRGHSVSGGHPGFLLGQFSPAGWWYYYPVAMLVKIPIPILLVFVSGIAGLFTARRFSKRELFFLLVPPALFLFIACFVNTVNIGVRHALPAYPFLLVIAGGSLLSTAKWAGKKTGLLLHGFLLLWLVMTSLSSFPNYLSYFNGIAPLLGGKENILGDSNITWGQDIKRLQDYVRDNDIQSINALIHFNPPAELDYYKIPRTGGAENLLRREPGLYVIDIFNYQSLVRRPEFAWLRDRKPDNRIGGSLLVFKL